MNDLKGKAVLTTSASDGIGAGCALALGTFGAKVAVHCNSSRSAADDVLVAIDKSGGEAFALQGNLRGSAQCARVVTEAAARWA